VTADPPRSLSPGDHFDLARAVSEAIENTIDPRHRGTLLGRFHFDPATNGGSRIDVLLAGPESMLIELAQYLTIPIPGEGNTALNTTDIDAYAELASAETALRAVVRAALPNWTADLDAAAIANLERKRAEEDKRRDGIAVSEDLLDYTEIYELQKIINKRWDPEVKAVLDDKKRTDVYLGIILDVRNAIGHPRPVYAAERLLLAGAAGQIRNQLARYRAKADGPQRHYPSLDSARDSMGNTAPSDPYFSGPSRTGPIPPPTPRLEVGDTVTFELEGTDPRGRELIWKAHAIPGGWGASTFNSSPVIGTATGDRVQITWTVSEKEVGEHTQIAIILANNGRYHRHQNNNYDDACVFRYHVNPPPDA